MQKGCTVSGRRMRAACMVSAVLMATTLAGCQGVSTPGADFAASQAMVDLGETMGQMREEDAILQAQIDSLRGVVAYQDTVIRQLSLMAGVSMRSGSASVP